MRPQGFSERQCTAKSRRSGERCRNFACRNRPTCRMHGGRSRRGAEHPNYKNGAHSAIFLRDRCFAYPSLCPKCRRLHGTYAELLDEKREMAVGFEWWYAWGWELGFDAGMKSGADARKHMAAAYKSMEKKRPAKAHSAPSSTLAAERGTGKDDHAPR
jgi:hypothetical protein